MAGLIKGIGELLVIIPLGGAAIGAIGSNLGTIGHGIGGATQTLISGGIVGKAASLFKF